MAEQKPDRGKKTVLLRLSSELYDEIAAWSGDEFRSVNGQIEYLLSEAVRKRKKSGPDIQRRQPD